MSECLSQMTKYIYIWKTKIKKLFDKSFQYSLTISIHFSSLSLQTAKNFSLSGNAVVEPLKSPYQAIIHIVLCALNENTSTDPVGSIWRDRLLQGVKGSPHFRAEARLLIQSLLSLPVENIKAELEQGFTGRFLGQNEAACSLDCRSSCAWLDRWVLGPLFCPCVHRRWF